MGHYGVAVDRAASCASLTAVTTPVAEGRDGTGASLRRYGWRCACLACVVVKLARQAPSSFDQPILVPASLYNKGCGSLPQPSSFRSTRYLAASDPLAYSSLLAFVSVAEHLTWKKALSDFLSATLTSGTVSVKLSLFAVVA